LPQPPQLFASVLKLVQSAEVPLPHSLGWDGGQLWQELLAQNWPLPQAFPHVLQFWVSLVVSAQVPEQHELPSLQTVPQPPQLLVSLFSSTQAPPQQDAPSGDPTQSVSLRQTATALLVRPSVSGDGDGGDAEQPVIASPPISPSAASAFAAARTSILESFRQRTGVARRSLRGRVCPTLAAR
jgi:hypothetical protein